MILKAVLIVLCAIQAQGRRAEDALCATKACPRNKECRVVADNPYTDEATLRAECVDYNIDGHRGACQIGETILMWHGSYYADLMCGPDSLCPESTYCNTQIMDTYSFCCRSDPTNPVKPGVCPNYPSNDFFCVNTCNNDGDCDDDYKCCTYGCRKMCATPRAA